MKVKNSFLTIIPARHGSKGIKNKNLSLVKSKPLIYYTLKAAQESKLIKDVVVTTDSKKIYNYSKKFNFFLIKRPRKISGDNSKIISAIKHVLKYKIFRKKYHYIILLQPTSPLRTSHNIDQAINLFLKKNAETLVSVRKVNDDHPARMYRKNGEYLRPLFPELVDYNRQKLDSVYHRNGAIYIFSIKNILKGKLYGKSILPFIMSQESSINIDNKIDLKLLKFFLG
jgi:CMP-N-acetylneuraminic acid synthetase